jgi:lipopolysaccharide export system permease protein
MKIIDRYIGKTILNSTLLVSVLFIGISIFITLIRQLDDLGTGSYGLLAVINYVFLDLPQQVYVVFPIISLVGTMFGLSMLANHNELTILRASGFSLNQIVSAVLKTSLVLLMLATLIGEWLAPITKNMAANYKEFLTSNGQSLTTREGTWMRDGENFLYIRLIVNNTHLEGVTRYQFDKEHRLTEVSYAKNGVYRHHQWTMQDVVSSQISSQQVTSERMPTASWKLSIDPKLLRIAVVDPDAMSLPQLYSYLSYLKINNLNTDEYALPFWQRIFRPMATLVMMLLAIPFVFGSLRTVTISLRLVIGIMVGFLFSLTNQFFGPISVVYQWPPFLAALLPTLIFTVAAYWLLRRVN